MTDAPLDTISARSFKLVQRPATAQTGRVKWPIALGVIAVHLLALLAFFPYFFSWTGVAAVFVGNYIFCSLGIGAGNHRLLTHRSYKCPKWFEHLLALLALCSLQDSPLRWVATHRAHHHHADEQPDPHSPMVALFWGHMGWVFAENEQFNSLAGYERYVRDMVQDRFYKNLQRNGLWAWVYFIHAVIFYAAFAAIGYIWTGTVEGAVQYGLSLLVWGVFVRTVYSWHVTWGVNSFGHRFGYRSYETGENSRNNWFFALATNGDGWHNNHHAQPRVAAHGFHKWWELDVTYLTILLWQKMGLAWDIIPRHRQFTHGRAPDVQID